MPPKEDKTVTVTKISTRAQIMIAVLGLIGTLTVAYWEFVLKPGEAENSVDFIYSGHVVDASNQSPLPGTKITFYINGSSRVAYTDSEGLYQFAVSLNALSSAQIRVDADGFQTYTRNITFSGPIDYVDEIRLIHLTTTVPTETSLPVAANTATEAPASAATSIATSVSDVADQLVQLIDNYYVCLNTAIPDDDDSDYVACWELLSSRPGEFQSNQNRNDFIAHWKKYTTRYALFYCSKTSEKNVQHFVHARYYLYNRNDDSSPIGNGTPFYLEYLFAHDSNGWRIKGANDNISDIGSFCESQPRINRLPQ